VDIEISNLAGRLNDWTQQVLDNGRKPSWQGRGQFTWPI